jgi:integrase/recombinase XerD
MDIESSFARFLKDRQVQQVSPNHLGLLRQKFKKLGEYLKSRGLTDTGEIDSEILADYMLTYIQPASGRKYSDWYIRSIANVVRTYLHFMEEMGFMREKIHLRMPKFHRPIPQIVEVEQMQQIIDHCDNLREKTLMAFFYDTGLRLQEVCDTIWGDVSFETGTLTVRHGKGDKFRFVALGKTMLRLLARYQAELETGLGYAPLPSDPVFPSSFGTPYTTRGLNSVFVRLTAKMGFRVTAHMLRRGYAKTARIVCKRDWEDIQSSMGHASIDQTRTYVGFLTQSDVQKARQTSPVDLALKVTSGQRKGKEKRDGRVTRK